MGSSSNVAENGIDKETSRAMILEVNPDGTRGKNICQRTEKPRGHGLGAGHQQTYGLRSMKEMN